MRLPIAFVLALGSAPLAARAEPPRTHEVLEHRPSGFWTSNRPATGGAYRYRLLGLGAVIALVSAGLMWRVVKRASSERAAGAATGRREQG